MSKGTFKSDEASRTWWGHTSDAARTFEQRWTWLHLRRVDPALATLLQEQRDLFDHATLVGSPGEIEQQGAALVRGWQAACKAMEQSGDDDSAYVIGRDPVSGLTVAIGNSKASADRVVELHGGEAIHITADEVATMFASVEGFKSIGAIKQRFPGAEVIGRYREQGT